MTTETYTTRQVCEMTGAAYRNVDYWCRIGHIPGQEGVTGSGHRRRWTAAQVDRVRILVEAAAMRRTLEAAVARVEQDHADVG